MIESPKQSDQNKVIESKQHFFRGFHQFWMMSNEFWIISIMCEPTSTRSQSLVTKYQNVNNCDHFIIGIANNSSLPIASLAPSLFFPPLPTKQPLKMLSLYFSLLNYSSSLSLSFFYYCPAPSLFFPPLPTKQPLKMISLYFSLSLIIHPPYLLHSFTIVLLSFCFSCNYLEQTPGSTTFFTSLSQPNNHLKCYLFTFLSSIFHHL